LDAFEKANRKNSRKLDYISCSELSDFSSESNSMSFQQQLTNKDNSPLQKYEQQLIKKLKSNNFAVIPKLKSLTANKKVQVGSTRVFAKQQISKE